MICSLFLQIITIVSGFIVPKMLIETFGSSVYGLTSSIVQFLGFMTLLQSGVGGVVIASLYKPLANRDNIKISSIIKAAENFFKKIAYITILYVCVLVTVFSFLLKIDYNPIYIFALIVIIAIGTFAQYFFGITYQLLLQADQKSHIYSIVQMGGVIANTIFVVLLVNIGAGIHIVKLGSSLVFLIRPLMLKIYVTKKYRIDTACLPDLKAISQRWSGMGHTVAYFIHTRTDIFLLTLFTNLKEVSVYSVYAIVVTGLNILISTVAKAVESAFGNMIAKDEHDILKINYDVYVCLTHMLTVVLFTSAAVLIIPFISIYTKTFMDANYIRPLFGYVLLAAEGMYCLRQPYHSIIISAGHYKQTRSGAFIEAAINIVVSLALIKSLGIVGVAIGTLLAMTYRTVDYVVYLKHNIIFSNTGNFIKRMLISLVTVVIIILLTNNIIIINMATYLNWMVCAIYVTLIAVTATLVMNLIFYRAELNNIFALLKGLTRKNL
jgi:O-antigen/teichoic acid export membrane protein